MSAPRLRLLFVIKSLALAGGGAERVLSDLSAGLADKGHAVTIASFDAPGAETFYKLHPDVAQVALGIGEVEQHTRLRDVPARIAGLRRLLRTHRPDVAIGFMHSAYVLLGLAASGSRIPVIASEHSVYAHYAERTIERALLWLTPLLASRMTFVSRGARDSFPRFIRRNSAVIPNPVTVTAIKRQPAGPLTILAVGRLDKAKDHATLIDAFAKVAPRFPEWGLRIAGEGDLRAALDRQIERLGLAGRVQLLGKVTNVDELFASASIFAMASRYESFGLATAEALAHGVPAIGFADCPGTNELIIDGRNGILVESSRDRASAMAAGLAQMIENTQLREQLARSAPLSVSAFTLEAVLEHWQALLGEIALAPERRG